LIPWERRQLAPIYFIGISCRHDHEPVLDFNAFKEPVLEKH